MAPQILLFAGTSEGRRLAERLSAHGISFYVSVATAYGETLLEHAHASILQGRMDREEIIAFLRAHPVECVVDATHPYAALATEHIRGAAGRRGRSICAFCVKSLKMAGGKIVSMSPPRRKRRNRSRTCREISY